MARTDGDEQFAALTQQGWLSSQSEDLRSRILERLRIQTFEPRATVYAIGDPPGGIYGLMHGTLAVTIVQGSNGPHLAHLATPGAWFGEGAFLTRRPRRIGLETVTECVLASLHLGEMEYLARNEPEVMRAFGQIAMFNIDLSVLAIGDLLINDPVRRVAAVLYRSSGGQPGAMLPITQAELGRLANASRKYTLSTLKRLAGLGIIRQGYHRIEVLAPDRLRCFADRDEPNA